MAGQSPIKVSDATKEKIRYLATLCDLSQAGLVDRAIDEFSVRHAADLGAAIDRASAALAAGDGEVAALLLDEPADGIRRVAGSAAADRRRYAMNETVTARDMKQARELETARRFMQRLSREDLVPSDKPDAPGRTSRPGGDPDYVFVDSTGQRYVIEVTRLLAPGIRRLEHRVIEDVTDALSAHLPGTYTLTIDYDRWSGRVPEPVASRSILLLVQEHLTRGTLPDSLIVYPGIEVRKISDEGHALVPWLEMDDPWDLGPGDPRWEALARAFQKLIAEANTKFKGHTGRRILIVDISLSLLDDELHACDIGGRPAPMLEWLTEGKAERENVDEIYLEPGVRVWRAQAGKKISESRRRVLTGHKYLEEPRGFYVKLWPPPSSLL